MMALRPNLALCAAMVAVAAGAVIQTNILFIIADGDVCSATELASPQHN